MKIVFLYNGLPLADFLQDGVFHGLRALLGDDVVEFPPNPRYRGAAPPPDERYPFLCFDYGPHPGGSLEELLADADALVIASLREGALPHVRRALALRPDLPSAFVDGEDDPYVRGIVRSVDVYFKRETLASAPWLRARMPARRLWHRLSGRAHPRDPLRRHVAVATAASRHVVPLPFGIVDTGWRPPPAEKEAEKEYDVAFVAAATNPERRRLVERLDRLRDDGLRVFTAEGGLSWSEYMDVLARSRIGISVPGLGRDTYRYWEIPYAGAMLLAEDPGIVIPDNFADSREAVFDQVERLDHRVRRGLENGAEEIAARGREALFARHTSVHRAQVVLDRLASL